MRVVKMRILRWMHGFTGLDKIRNKCIRERVGVIPIDVKMRKTCLRWFNHVQRRFINAHVRCYIRM